MSTEEKPENPPILYANETGISLRDLFAAAALTGMLAFPGDGSKMENYAKWSYQYADAMLKARKEGQ